MNDFNLNNGRGALNDDIDLILQQIDILFDTNPREVFGNESFGTTYDKYLYQLKDYQVACVGDQLLTDILGANKMGFTSIT